jgi:hypothetical protein
MLMRTIPRHRRPVQLELFQGRPARPHWKALPPEVRQAALPLLVRLLKEHRAGHPALAGGKGVSDE